MADEDKKNEEPKRSKVSDMRSAHPVTADEAVTQSRIFLRDKPSPVDEKLKEEVRTDVKKIYPKLPEKEVNAAIDRMKDETPPGKKSKDETPPEKKPESKSDEKKETKKGNLTLNLQSTSDSAFDGANCGLPPQAGNAALRKV